MLRTICGLLSAADHCGENPVPEAVHIPWVLMRRICKGLLAMTVEHLRAHKDVLLSTQKTHQPSLTRLGIFRSNFITTLTVS